MSVNPSHCMIAAILLLVGAKMVVDPSSFSTLPANFGMGIRNFEQSLRGQPWRNHLLGRRWQRPRYIELSPRGKMGMRIAGVVVIAVGMLTAAVA